MQNNEISFKVAKLIAEQLEKSEKEISLDCSFDQLGADSLDQIEILMRTEELFNIFITDQEAVKIRCANDLVNCVHEQVSK
ncbi:MAG: acyl carrier protein [Candidatus Babeliales bacterium]|nr:acyl carrier protein [Candidatus Babeliales bacterium]